MNPDFWRERRVFLTGHTGFKGSWLSLWLQQCGARVTGFALDPPTQPSLFEVADVGRGMVSNIADVRDEAALRHAMRQAQPEVVIHMAAQPLVRESYRDPVGTYATNVMGTVHLFEAVRSVGGVRVVVNVTTDKCYENRETLEGYRETDPMGGFDPYSSSKACSELASAAYRSSYFNARDYGTHGVAVATARAGNVIGGGDWASDRLLPDVIAAFERNVAVRIRSPGSVRPWQHVLEPLRGYMMLAERLYTDGVEFAGAWNFGPGAEDARPVAWIVEQMASLWGEGAAWAVDPDQQPHEAGLLRLDINKARTRLGWNPQLDVRQACGLVVDWTRARHRGGDMRRFTLEQIFDYQSDAVGQ